MVCRDQGVVVGLFMLVAALPASADYQMNPYQLDPASVLPSRTVALQYLEANTVLDKHVCEIREEGARMWRKKPFGISSVDGRVPLASVYYLMLESNGRIKIELRLRDNAKQYCLVTRPFSLSAGHETAQLDGSAAIMASLQALGAEPVPEEQVLKVLNYGPRLMIFTTAFGGSGQPGGGPRISVAGGNAEAQEAAAKRRAVVGLGLNALQRNANSYAMKNAGPGFSSAANLAGKLTSTQQSAPSVHSNANAAGVPGVPVRPASTFVHGAESAGPSVDPPARVTSSGGAAAATGAKRCAVNGYVGAERSVYWDGEILSCGNGSAPRVDGQSAYWAGLTCNGDTTGNINAPRCSVEQYQQAIRAAASMVPPEVARKYGLPR